MDLSSLLYLKENIDPSHYLSKRPALFQCTDLYFILCPSPSSLLILFSPPKLHLPPQSPHLPHPSCPFIHLPPPHMVMWDLKRSSSSSINCPSMSPPPPPAPLHDPSPPSLSGGNKNHHFSYLPPFWIDLSISTSAPLRLFYLSTCLTLLVALLSL